MKILKTIAQAEQYIDDIKSQSKAIGFVPTMGALHSGHISLLKRATIENDVVACSIFVNPIQFNNPDDLKNYPRTIDDDIQKLEEIECDILFYPEVKEVYPEPVFDKYNFGQLDKVLEGKFRPGHFNGVAVIVRKLFEIIQPDRAYFGMKDYQQLRIIQTMTENLELPVQIIPCPTLREKNGLAMSSRNVRLTAKERLIAPSIYRILVELKKKATALSVAEAESWALSQLNNFKELKVEYLEIVDSKTLLPVKDWKGSDGVVVCVAVHLGYVRLIDNLIIF
nr:pantoate--beta-alanine ligase [Bacteroidota bacterium]